MGVTSSTFRQKHKPVCDLAEANTAFALHLYQTIKKGKDAQNVFFSPLSISIALAMTHLGAQGNTAAEIAEVFRFRQVEAYRDGHIHHSFKEVIEHLFHSESPCTVAAANKLYAKSGYPILEAFLKGLASLYKTTIEAVDDFSAPEGTKSINDWVSQQTKGKINDLIAPGVFDSTTKLVLVNAIYFRGRWDETFSSHLTKEDSFKVLDSRQTVTAKIMYQSNMFPLAIDEINDCLILELPYVGNEFSMMIALPRKDSGLPELESKLSVGLLQSWISQLRQRKVNVYLPKFKVEEQFELKAALQEMGMSDTFGNKANFKGISKDEELEISAVVHKAFVDVDEEGSEAAAATAVMMLSGYSMPLELEVPVDFRADHPFLFVICHRRSQSILFMGRLSDPCQ